MRIRLTKSYDGQPAGFQGDWPDDRAKAAVDAGAAVPTARVRLTRDYDLGGRKLPARFEFDLSPDEAAKAVGDGAGEYADIVSFIVVPLILASRIPSPRRWTHSATF